MIVVTAFSNSYDSCFRTYVTIDLAALTLRNFLTWLKTKTNQKNHLFLTKILSFFADFSSNWTGLVSNVALYKEFQATDYSTYYYPSYTHSLIPKLYHLTTHIL